MSLDKVLYSYPISHAHTLSCYLENHDVQLLFSSIGAIGA